MVSLFDWEESSLRSTRHEPSNSYKHKIIVGVRLTSIFKILQTHGAIPSITWCFYLYHVVHSNGLPTFVFELTFYHSSDFDSITASASCATMHAGGGFRKTGWVSFQRRSRFAQVSCTWQLMSLTIDVAVRWNVTMLACFFIVVITMSSPNVPGALLSYIYSTIYKPVLRNLPDTPAFSW